MAKPPKTRIDLSGLADIDLDAPSADVAPDSADSGKPLEIELSLIDEDPNQPRREFDPERMAEMAASIKLRGVKSPISVKPHPTKPGRWMLNFGARRYRSSIAAGKRTIPAIVDEVHDSYDQVIENLQREDLSPMELALFIAGKISGGEKQSDIANNLGKPKNVITEHLALIGAPACVEEAYTAGKTRSPKTLYDLRRLHEKFPEQVDSWASAQTEITRGQVAQLAAELGGKKQVVKAGGDTGAGASSRGEGSGAQGDEGGAGRDEGAGSGQQNGQSGDAGEGGEVHRLPSHNVANEGALSPKGKSSESDPSRIKKPVLLVEYDSRAAMVLIFNRPSTPGLLHIKYEDNGEEVEVDARKCVISHLQEAQG